MTVDPQASSAITVPTSRFGELKIDPDKVISMTCPLLGFPNEKRFLLWPHPGKSPFMWFQSIDDPQLAFVVIRSAVLVPQYQPMVPSQIRAELQASEGELDTLLILTIPKDHPEKMTANLLGPLLVNPIAKLARQVLQDPTEYEASWPVFTADPGEAGSYET